MVRITGSATDGTYVTPYAASVAATTSTSTGMSLSVRVGSDRTIPLETHPHPTETLSENVLQLSTGPRPRLNCDEVRTIQLVIGEGLGVVVAAGYAAGWGVLKRRSDLTRVVLAAHVGTE